MEKLWIIRCINKEPFSDETLYWNNDTGYQDLESADIYNDAEKEGGNLPIEGEWIPLDKDSEKVILNKVIREDDTEFRHPRYDRKERRF